MAYGNERNLKSIDAIDVRSVGGDSPKSPLQGWMVCNSLEIGHVICIEKWFANENNTCPETEQTLAHLCLTPNYCVKGLAASWCEQNGVLVPEGPPDALDVNYWKPIFD
ncbi:U-box domain-containing protein 45-like protein [Tanacetum coccineum]